MERNELNGALYAARFKAWIYKQLICEFGTHYLILNKRIVQDIIKKESYALNTFTGLRVSEIQKKTVPYNWIHVSGKENVADVLTKGGSLEFLQPG